MTRDPHPPVGHGTGRRLFHWVTVAAVVVLFAAGIAMTSEGFEGLSDALYVTHKGLGSVLALILILRLVWRFVTPPPPPLPDSVSATERRLARIGHVGLYLMLGVMVSSGYLRTVTGGFPIELLDLLGVPPLVGEAPGLSTVLSVVHTFAGYLFLFLVALHVGAVARHGLVEKDGVFSRMWPPWAPDRSGVE